MRPVSIRDRIRVPVTRTDRDNIPDADGDFSNAPNFNWNDGKLKFDANWTDNANDNFGSVSGFGSKSLPFNKHPLRMLVVLFGSRSQPASNHSSDLINDSLEYNVFLRI